MNSREKRQMGVFVDICSMNKTPFKPHQSPHSCIAFESAYCVLQYAINRKRLAYTEQKLWRLKPNYKKFKKMSKLSPYKWSSICLDLQTAQLKPTKYKL